MFTIIKNYFLKKIYKALILKAALLDKGTSDRYERSKIVYALDISTSKGKFTFLFKEDRRKKNRSKFCLIRTRVFLVELTMPEGLDSKDACIEDKVVIVVKVMLVKVDYEVFANILADIYLDEMLEYVRLRNN